MSEPIELMYMAIATPLGICISVSDFERVQQRLYQTRRKCADPALDCLQFTRSPFNPESELWIIKQGKVDGQALAQVPIPAPNPDHAEPSAPDDPTDNSTGPGG